MCIFFSIRSLESSLKDSKPVAIQLRMLEEFTSHQSFNNPGDPVGNRKDAAMVTVYLARNGKSSESLIYNDIINKHLILWFNIIMHPDTIS